MASVEIDGLQVPITVAGLATVELCNTRAGWGSPQPKEYLHTYRHLAVWARHAGLTATVPRAAGRRGEAILHRALAFREEFYAALTGGTPDWSVLDAEARRLGVGLVPSDGPAPARWDLGDDAELPLRAAVFGAVQVLTSPVGRGVRACPGAGCGWVFYDPRGRRRWCIMAVCGNRAKAARFSARAAVR
jgi:predicted RNA-binding Zn ribbon-like protein